jgi:hypothetical protein
MVSCLTSGSTQILTCRSNKEDLDLISQMGITPDMTVHERRPTLKAAGLAVVAAIRMKKMSEGWAQNRKIHEQLKQKLDSMRRQSGRRNGAGLRVAR